MTGSAGYVDQEYVAEISELSDDNTIGIVQYMEGPDDDILIDIQRLRELLICYEEELEGSTTSARLSVRDIELVQGNETKVLALRPNGSEGAATEVALAERVPLEEGEDDD